MNFIGLNVIPLAVQWSITRLWRHRRSDRSVERRTDEKVGKWIEKDETPWARFNHSLCPVSKSLNTRILPEV